MEQNVRFMQVWVCMTFLNYFELHLVRARIGIR